MLISVIIVAYNSDVDKLNTILGALDFSVRYIIVDNSTDLERRSDINHFCTKSGAIYVPMIGNVGIASAQNAGLAKAIELNSTDILFLDDDSIPDPSMLSVLLSGRNKCATLIQNMPIVCANAVNVSGENLSVFGDSLSDGIYACRDLISSGTLINVCHIESVGLFEDKLFIDCVDFEWGWRALSLGFHIYIIENAKLNHCLGDGVANVIPMKYPSPIRHYYQYRNILYMFCRPYAPLKWKLSQLAKLPVKFLLILFLLDEKKKRATYALKGVVDFFKNKYGSF
ncbi:glycosyltransferase [Buttiauxella sp. B2]|uniref:glycosyltransferase n=1 Tax=Buttiauxella sp. B2 TaxID=2587812 RepID=UPI0011221251|nr:glycosyltransferase [Buttiauxella sp. B2]TNV19003.1 glycosyltransferase [Buttiauxella sp. B2]